MEPQARPQAEPRTPAPLPAAVVLVVDDDPDARKEVSSLLEQDGLVARGVSTMQEALTVLANDPPDGLIADVLLPDGSGYELVKRLRALPGGDRVGAVVVSRRGGFLDKVEAIQCGADAFFEKPVDWDALLRRLQHLLERERLGPARILSVEDDPMQARFLETILRTAGYDVHICTEVGRFEADLTAFRPDLVIMDILLPSVSGLDLVRYLRQDERYATLPVLLLTTEGRTETRIGAAAAGGDEFLQKPVAPGLLLTAVAARIERSRFLRALINRDGLTRLLTHSAFLERARMLLYEAKRRPLTAAWIMIDLDHFKDVNDRFGHPTGDRVLVALSSLLRRRLRQSDAIGRYGGEEFTILLTGLDTDEATRLVERLRSDFAALDHTAQDGSTFRTTFSAGISMFAAGIELPAWRQAADRALYAAKQSGRNRVAVAGPDGRPRVLREAAP